jgi:NAD(P)-dependent dehydrogenase (short-subunit alcohol dehydrogenase family)
MAAKTVLITGALRGIGRAAALAASARGWAVGVNYAKDEVAAQDVVDIIARSGGRAVALRGDVSSEEDVVAMFEGTRTALGRVTGVVVNAGIVAPTAKLVDMRIERMRRVFEVNVLGPV